MLTCLIAPLAMTRQGSVTLLYRPPLNKTYKYRMTMKTTQNMGAMGAQNMTMQMDMDMKATSRTGDQTTMVTKIVGATVTVPPNSPIASMAKTMEASMKGQTSQVIADSHYHTSKIKMDGPGAGMAKGMGQALQSFRFPSKPIRVGDTWTSPMDLGPMMGGTGMKVSGSLLTVCKLLSAQNGKAKISATVKGSVKIGTMTDVVDGSGYSVLDIATGMMVEVKMSTTSKMSASGQSFSQHVDQLIKGR